MELKLFGKSIFEYSKNKSSGYLIEAMEGAKTSKYLPDFYKGFAQDDSWIPLSVASLASTEVVALENKIKKSMTGKKGEKKVEKKREFTPKEVYNLQMLNDKSFVMKADPEYVEKQIAEFKDKLGLVSSEEYDMRRGVEEISSVLVRLENRKKYKQFENYYSEFPYTTSGKIAELVKEHDNLQMGQVAQFVADLPAEATKVMKEYTEQTKLLCEKMPVFYIIADKKDFKKTEKRRDPILLAQSPFGHWFQILGAWAEEMLMLDEL